MSEDFVPQNGDNTPTSEGMERPSGMQQALDEWLREKGSAPQDVIALSIVVPSYNEERRLPPTLIDMIDFFDGHESSYEIIVVDDGSRDGTTQVTKKFERIRSQVRRIILPKNYGKGHAVRTGALNAKGELILFADADGSTPIGEVDRLVTAIRGGADIAIGSRALRSEETEVKTRFYRKIIGRVFNGLVNFFLIPGIADTQCGFKLFTRRAARFVFSKQTSDGFSFDIELLLLARKVGLTVKEVPVNWTNIPGSKVNLIIDSAKMFLDIFRFAFIHRSILPSDYEEVSKENL